jgi:DNA-binding response OmpR family regulator
MNLLRSRSVVLVSDDFQLLNLVAAELREMGCRVFCVRDFQEAAALVRAGATRRFVLVRIGVAMSSAELRQAMAEQLPGYAIRGEGLEDEEAWAATQALQSLRQLPN